MSEQLHPFEIAARELERRGAEAWNQDRPDITGWMNKAAEWMREQLKSEGHKSGTLRPLWALFVEEARVELEDRTDHLPTRVSNALGYLRQAAECHKPGTAESIDKTWCFKCGYLRCECTSEEP